MFTIDDRYIKPLAVALQGLMETSAIRRKVYVFHEHLHPFLQFMLRLWLRNTTLTLRIQRLDPRHPIHRFPHHFSRAILLRLLVAPLIEEPEFLYLDSDILIRADMGALDAISLEGATIMASPRALGADRAAMAGDVPQPSYASGLLVIDRRRFIAERVGERCLQLIRRNDFDYPDQEALNRVCGARDWKPLPSGLNLEVADTEDAWTQLRLTSSGPEQGAVVLQLAGSEKPWHLLNRHPCRREFRQILRRTPFRLLPCGPRDVRCRSLLSRLRHRCLRRVRRGSRADERRCAG